MPRATIQTRPDKKLTDFFGKKLRTGPRPGQPIYDVSSSSERQSIISISSDDVFPSGTVSHSGQSTRDQAGIPRPNIPRSRGKARSKVQRPASPSKPSQTRSDPISISSSGSLNASTNKPSTLTGSLSQSPVSLSSMPKKNARKRKQQPINLISSEESDGPVLPSIHVQFSPKKSDRESRPIPQQAARDEHPHGLSPAAPLTPRQNLLSHLKSSPQKSDVAALSKPSLHQLKIDISTVSTHNRPSPPKRARYDSSSSDKHKSSAPGFDADDEGDDQVNTSSKSIDKPTSATSRSLQLEVDNVDGTHMEVDLSTRYSTPAPNVGAKDDMAEVDNAKEYDSGSGVLKSSSDSNIQPREKTQEVLRSSHQGETDLSMDNSHMDVCDGDTVEHLLALPTVSPAKARTDSIIARIKAKAEADAAAQAEDDHRRSSFGFTGSDISDLSSLSSISTDEDEAELELDMNAFGKGGSVKFTDPSTYSVIPLGVGTRRSARHVDIPAPNYAKKLELFRGSLTPSGKGKYDADEKGKSKSKVPEVCPLDMLLKDRAREGARKARVETKRKGVHPEAFGSDPAPPRDCSTFETPRRVHHHAKTESPGNDMSSPQDGHVQGILMGAAAREELLGKAGAKAVGKILDNDRKKKSNTEKKECSVLFWRTDVEGDSDSVPELVATNPSHPFLTALIDAVRRKEYGVASHLVDSGALSSAPLSVQLLDWLFATAMSTACSDISLSAYRALLVLLREVCSAAVVARPCLSSTRLLTALFKLGVNTQTAEMFGSDADDKVSPVGMSPELRLEMLRRFFSMLEVLSRSQSIDPKTIPSTVSILLFLSLDPSAVPELQQDAVSAIEALLASPNVTRIVELDTCKFVLRVTKDMAFTPDLQARLLTLLPGCSSNSGRVRRWIAWAMLGGDLQSVHGCTDVPPIQLMVDLFSKTSPGVVKVEVTPHTDYEQLGAVVNILSVAMTDVDAYVRHGNGSALARSLYKALEHLNGKIVDTRAAHMDRTKTKEAINRLHKRLIYQRHAVLEMLRTKTGKMDQFLVAKPKSASQTKSEQRLKEIGPIFASGRIQQSLT